MTDRPHPGTPAARAANDDADPPGLAAAERATILVYGGRGHAGKTMPGLVPRPKRRGRPHPRDRPRPQPK